MVAAGFLVFFALLVVVLVVAAIRNPRFDDVSSRGAFAGAAVLFTVIALVIAGFTMVTAVDARSYGVITAAGKYQKTVDSGVVTHAPWAKVEEFTTTNQTVELSKDGKALKVNFANGGSADVDGKITYHIKDKKGIESLWKEYLTPDKVEKSLVEPAARSAARTDVSLYTPFDALKGASQNKMEVDIKNELNSQLGKRGLEVRSVEIYRLEVDPDTQKRINQQAQVKADAIIKLGQKENALIDAQKDVIRKGTSPAQDRCIELFRTWNVAVQGQIPLSMNCNLGSSIGVTPGVK